MKRFLVCGLIFSLILAFAAPALAGNTPNPELRGIPINVTITTTTVTNTPVQLTGSALNRTCAYVTNTNSSFNVRVTFANTTYTAKDLINAGICVVVPPCSTVPISGANYSPGPWTSSFIYGKYCYADVSPTALNVQVGFQAEKLYPTPPDR